MKVERDKIGEMTNYTGVSPICQFFYKNDFKSALIIKALPKNASENFDHL